VKGCADRKPILHGSAGFPQAAVPDRPGLSDTDLFIQEAEWMKEVADWPMPKIEADKNPKFE